MYFWDPQNGNRRKAMVRDRAIRAQNQAVDAFDQGVSDLRNRARGWIAGSLALLGDENISDEVIAERVRSRLGFLTRHAGAIQVSAQNHHVTLRGDVLANEVGHLIAGVSRVRGVRGVENQMRVHDEPGNIPALQGPGWLPEDTPGQWRPSTRLLAAAGGTSLFLYGLIRGGFTGTLARVSGVVLGARALANQDLQTLIGLNQPGAGQGAIRVHKIVQIKAPVDRVYQLWSNFENFPKFMKNIESIENTGDNKSHWVVKGPAGSKVEFDAIVTENKPDQVIAWETTPGSTVQHSGQVHFTEAGQQSTQVSVNMAYTPPAGVAGAAVATLFGKDPKSEMDEDLARMKSLIEEGKTSAGNKTVTRDEMMPVTSGVSEMETKKEDQDGN
jgi:uncharacterized membrane protein